MSWLQSQSLSVFGSIFTTGRMSGCLARPYSLDSTLSPCGWRSYLTHLSFQSCTPVKLFLRTRHLLLPHRQGTCWIDCRATSWPLQMSIFLSCLGCIEHRTRLELKRLSYWSPEDCCRWPGLNYLRNRRRTQLGSNLLRWRSVLLFLFLKVQVLRWGVGLTFASRCSPQWSQFIFSSFFLI